MLHTIGDSHAHAPFLNIPGVLTHWVGPVTMKRIGHPSESLLLDTAAVAAPKKGDSLLLCFGEIDIRCWAHVHVSQRKREPNALLADWTSAYLDKAALLARIVPTAILSIVPPSRGSAIDRQEFPVAGSDAERAEYTRIANRLLAEGCPSRGLLFADVHSLYADGYGMMRRELADSSVHINDTRPLKSLLRSLSLLPPAPPDR
jgi:hypothetical protein